MVLARLACLGLAGAVIGQQLPPACDALIPGTPLNAVNPAAPGRLDVGNATVVQVEILGHSESRGYHTFLQQLLDAQPPLPGVQFVVRNGFIGGHEAWRWASPGERGYRRIDDLLASRAHPMIVLGLFSNNASRPLGAPTPGDSNFDGLVRDLEAIADHLWDGGDGARMIYLSSHRYKPSNLLPCYYERFAVEHVIASSNRSYVKAGPEQHDLHRCCFPDCYAGDRAHTNRAGDELMATAWYHLLVREMTGCFSEPYGDGASGSAGAIPVLATSGGFPRVGNRDFALRTSAVLGDSALVYLFGLRRTPPPLVVAPFATIVTKADAAGSHTLPLPIPNLPGLDGSRLHVQVGSHDPAGAFLGFALSQGLTLAVCR